MASSTVPLHFLGQDIRKEVQYDSFGHVKQMASSNAPLHFLGQDDQNKMQYDIFGHMMPLHQHHHHVMPTASFIGPLNSLGQEMKMRCN